MCTAESADSGAAKYGQLPSAFNSIIACRRTGKIAPGKAEAVTCTRLAQHGITGPANFLEGAYGYFHLVGRDRLTEMVEEVDLAPGFPERPLTDEKHRRRFRDCIAFAANPFPEERVRDIIAAADSLDEMDDVRALVPLLLKG